MPSFLYGGNQNLKMMKRTKIVATVSDYRSSYEYVKSLFDAGMDVVRMNTAHIDREGAMKLLTDARSVSDKIAVLIDTKGPEVRTCELAEGLKVEEGTVVKVTGDLSLEADFHVNYPGFVGDVPAGSTLLIDDGEIELIVKEKNDNMLVCEATNAGTIKNRKSLNVPDVTINLPSLTAKDRDFIHFAIENEIEFIAHSFVRNKRDVLDIQDILDEHDSNIKIIAKIENQEGVDNIDEILDVAYGVMIARGDLGIEIPAAKIPSISRELIRKCVRRQRPVIMATQMLHTMIENPRPTRAEVSDIASAVYNRVDAIMLSGETANGNYGVEAVKVMDTVSREIETSKDRRNDILPSTKNSRSALLSKMAIEAAEIEGAAAVVTDTLSGHNARHLSSFRGELPVYAKCYLPRVMRELSLSYGVYPTTIEPKKHRDKTVKAALKSLITENEVAKDDNVVYLGSSFGVRGKASYLECININSVIEKKTDIEE